jgi:hypothetical protein
MLSFHGRNDCVQSNSNAHLDFPPVPTETDAPPMTAPSARLPDNPADCDDPETALTLWQGKIAKGAKGETGLQTLQAACLDMQRRAPLYDPFRLHVIKTLSDCANRHLRERYSPETIEPIIFDAFPESGDDVASDKADTDAEIAKLAKLSVTEYERKRTAASKRLGMRSVVLDRLVSAERSNDAEPTGQGRSFEIAEIEPWPDPVEGAGLLTDIANAIRHYVVLPVNSRLKLPQI